MGILYRQEEVMTEPKKYTWLGMNNYDLIYYVQTK